MKKLLSFQAALVVLVALCVFLAIPASAETAEPIGHNADVLSEYVDVQALVERIHEGLSQFKTEISIADFRIPASDTNRDALFDFLIENTIPYFNVSNFQLSILRQNYDAVYPIYSCTAQEYTQKKRQIDAVAAQLLDGLIGNTTLTDAEKALIVHDRLAVHIEYDLTLQKRSLYDALVGRVCVCEGYTKAYNYLLGLLGISSYTCSSDYHTHMWSIVRIDGEDYHVDVTWDDPTNDITGRVNHDNFLRSSAGIAATGHGIVGSLVDFNTAPDCDKYDNAYWQNSYAQFQLVDGKLYYIDSKDQTLNAVNGNNRQVLCSVEDLWRAGTFSYWVGSYARLSSDGVNLIYSLSDKVYCYDLATNTSSEIFAPEMPGKYFNIFGMKLEDGYLYCDLSNTPNFDRNTKKTYQVKIPYTQAPLKITTQPVNKTAPAKTTAVFSLKATGNGLTYQWQYRTSSTGKWTNASATGNKTDTLKVPATAGKNGYQYRCRITDANGEKLFSRTVTLTVTVPKVTVHPSNQNIPTGKTASFAVKATGSGLKYQWQYRTSKTGKWANASATGNKTATLKVPVTLSRNGYQYRCRITDQYGNVIYSNAATLKAVTLKINTQPVNRYLPAGKTANFTVKATGTSLKYQWQYRTSATGKWANATATGNKTATVKVPVTAAKNGFQYRCKITDQYGNVIYSNTVNLKVVTLKITAQPVNRTVKAGKTAVFTVKANGTKLKYQWQYRVSANGKWSNTSATGSKTVSLQIPATKARNGYQYRCVITDTYGNVIYSNAAKLTVK